MKIAWYMDDGMPAYAIVEDGELYRTDGTPFTGLTKKEHVGPLDEANLLVPVEPQKIVAIGLNYALHVTENDPTRETPSEPVIFMKPTTALLAHDGVIKLPPAERIDYEAELCIVMGREAYRVSEEDALDFVLGYTCGNDVSHRDYQRKDGQPVRAKGFNTFAPLGPVIETDLDPNNVKIQSRLNGEVRQDSHTSNLIFTCETLIAAITDVMTLYPGDVIMTGTPEGVGPMVPGDTIEIEIEGIGVLRNRCEARE